MNITTSDVVNIKMAKFNITTSDVVSRYIEGGATNLNPSIRWDDRGKSVIPAEAGIQAHIPYFSFCILYSGFPLTPGMTAIDAKPTFVGVTNQKQPALQTGVCKAGCVFVGAV